MKPCKYCGREHPPFGMTIIPSCVDALIDRLKSAMREEIEVADKQIELLKLRIKENPKIEENVRPFGSALWRMKRNLEKALGESSNDQAHARPNNP